VNIVKYQGEKRISSIPFVLALNALAGGVIGNSTERTQVTIGSEVPVPTTTFATANDKTAQPLRSFNYRNVGTVMSAAAVTAEGGQFEIDLSVDESSVGTNAFDSRGGSPAEMPGNRPTTRTTKRWGPVTPSVASMCLERAARP
jgi:hypothetical protein